VDKHLDYLLNEYRDRINMLQNAISTGNCVNYEEYKYACGQIRGLESACLAITDLKQRMEKSND
jgi:hypothetical protein